MTFLAQSLHVRNYAYWLISLVAVGLITYYITIITYYITIICMKLNLL